MEPEGSLPYRQVPATCPRSISPGPRLSVWTVRNKIRFYGEELLAPRPTLKLEDHPLSAVRDCILFSVFAAVLRIGSRSSIRAMPWWQGPTYHGIYTRISTAQQSLVDQGLLIFEASQSHSIRHTTFGRTPLDEWSAQRRDLYLTNRQHPARDRHTSPRRDSNPQSQQASGSRRRGIVTQRNDILRLLVPVIPIDL
jgi:hypothetical protein